MVIINKVNIKTVQYPVSISPNTHHMVGGDVGGDSDHFAGPVVTHDHAVSELPPGRLVLPHLGVPGVSADPAPAANLRAPLMALAATESLHPVVIPGVGREPVVSHHGAARGLHHAPVTPGQGYQRQGREKTEHFCCDFIVDAFNSCFVAFLIIPESSESFIHRAYIPT